MFIVIKDKFKKIIFSKDYYKKPDYLNTLENNFSKNNFKIKILYNNFYDKINNVFIF